MMDAETLRHMAEWGPGLLIGVMILAGLFRLADRVGMRLVAASERQAEALAAQAEAMQGLTTSIRDFVTRDNSEHREMLVLLRFIAQEQQHSREQEEEKVEH